MRQHHELICIENTTECNSQTSRKDNYTTNKQTSLILFPLATNLILFPFHKTHQLQWQLPLLRLRRLVLASLQTDS